MPFPLDEFEVIGLNGTHQCYTMIPVQCNLKEVSFNHLFPLEVTRALSYSLTLAIAYIQSRGYLHRVLSREVYLDVYIRNTLVKLHFAIDQLSIDEFYELYGDPDTVQITKRDRSPPPSNIPAKAVVPLYLGKIAEEFTLDDTHVLLSDFGESFNPTSEPRRSEDCHTPLAARPPEALFAPQAPLLFSADIWSLAKSIWEILGMKAIFSSEHYSSDELASQQIDILGPLPRDWWEQWPERSEFFHADGRPTKGRYVWPPIEQAFEEGIQNHRRVRQVGEYWSEESIAILDLMRRMLTFRPEDRPTAEEVLRSEWMAKWCLLDFERSWNSS
ncbi:hypothetical protein NUU61_002869 [Penicillium alfredii]|uniref:Protein kinase domain-containing protein n=1 Tax=Penicillium alfredii TaxID=1506179 RepID=A0A9W9FSG5_9EURO|nr:uncharacterized protein NUU61_002869 [Penicillium alfredii]KAJ5105522.1 hypothetical protein NUU61_002869 [Penicillium alfredii]